MRTFDPVRLASALGIVLAFLASVLGGLSVAFGDTYTVDSYVHDLALLVLGLGAISFAANRQPRSLVSVDPGRPE